MSPQTLSDSEWKSDNVLLLSTSCYHETLPSSYSCKWYLFWRCVRKNFSFVFYLSFYLSLIRNIISVAMFQTISIASVDCVNDYHSTSQMYFITYSIIIDSESINNKNKQNNCSYLIILLMYFPLNFFFKNLSLSIILRVTKFYQTDFFEILYLGIFRIADYKLKVGILKFKMTDPI